MKILYNIEGRYMKVIAECIPCYFKQAISALNAAKASDEVKTKALYDLMKVVLEISLETNPGENSSIVMHSIIKSTGIADPFKQAKKDSNELALKLYDELEEKVLAFPDSLYMAFKVSAAGNIIDMGINSDFDINAALDEATSKEFDVCDYRFFRELLDKSIKSIKPVKPGKLLFIGDNSGEIVFDRMLVKELLKLGLDVTYAVKGGPVLNDATMEDAEETGMTQVCRVITNGNNFLGTNEKYCSKEFLDEYHRAGLVITKGQANYESLEGTRLAGDKTFFVLRIKCESVAECAGARFGDLAFIRNKVK